MTGQKLQETMIKYEKRLNIYRMISFGIGSSLLGAGCIFDKSSLSVAGGSTIIFTMLEQGIFCANRYFNERLEIENQRNKILKQNQLEKNLSELNQSPTENK